MQPKSAEEEWSENGKTGWPRSTDLSAILASRLGFRMQQYISYPWIPRCNSLILAKGGVEKSGRIPLQGDRHAFRACADIYIRMCVCSWYIPPTIKNIWGKSDKKFAHWILTNTGKNHKILSRCWTVNVVVNFLALMHSISIGKPNTQSNLVSVLCAIVDLKMLMD